MLFQADADRSVELDRGAVVRAGHRGSSSAIAPATTTVVHYNEAGVRLGSFVLKPGATVVGRESPDVTIAPADGGLVAAAPRADARVEVVSVKDLGSANGTQFRCRGRCG